MEHFHLGTLSVQKCSDCLKAPGRVNDLGHIVYSFHEINIYLHAVIEILYIYMMLYIYILYLLPDD